LGKESGQPGSVPNCFQNTKTEKRKIGAIPTIRYKEEIPSRKITLIEWGVGKKEEKWRNIPKGITSVLGI